jgi:hypothetical protein
MELNRTQVALREMQCRGSDLRLPVLKPADEDRANTGATWHRLQHQTFVHSAELSSRTTQNILSIVRQAI